MQSHHCFKGLEGEGQHHLSRLCGTLHLMLLISEPQCG